MIAIDSIVTHAETGMQAVVVSVNPDAERVIVETMPGFVYTWPFAELDPNRWAVELAARVAANAQYGSATLLTNKPCAGGHSVSIDRLVDGDDPLEVEIGPRAASYSWPC